MSIESQVIDPYEAVLADLRAQRDRIDQAIAAIEALRGGSMAGSSASAAQSQNTGVEGPSAFLGMTIPDAAKKLLAARRQSLRNPDIAAAFKAGGLVLQSKEPANTIGSVLTRRANEVGDIVRVGRGLWGLKEWYPGRSFKKDRDSAKPENGEKGEGEASPTEGQDRPKQRATIPGWTSEPTGS